MPAIASPIAGVRSVHVAQELTNFSLSYAPQGFVAEQVFSIVPVAHETDKYLVWDKGSAFRVLQSNGYGTLRADGTVSREENYGGTQATYEAEEFALSTRVTDRQRANADTVWQLETTFVRKMQDKLMLDYELRVASICTTSGNYAASNLLTLAGANQWNNASFVSTTNGSHSIIYGELLTGMDAIRKSTGGLLPNTIVIPYSVAQIMRNDPGFWDMIKYQASSIADGTDKVLPPEILGMKVLIPRAAYITSVEGEAVTLADVWGKNVFMAYVDPNPSVNSLTFGTTFRQRPWQVKTWRREETSSTFYEASLVQAEVLITADCGYLIASAIA